MDNINFLFFDDIDLKGTINNNNLKVLKVNDNGTFRLDNLPYIISCTLQEFQRQIGPLIYIIDEEKDTKLIEKYANRMNHLERVTEINFLFLYDIDSNDITNNDNLKVLEANDDGTFRTNKLPDITGNKEEIKTHFYLIDGKIEQYRSIIYIVDEYKDSELMEKYGKDKVRNVKISENSYHVVAGYDKDSICVKGTNIVKPTDEPSLRFVKVDKLNKSSNSKDIILLKQNDDGTVSIVDAPISIRKSILQYEDTNNCFLVAAIGENDIYDADDIMQLEETGIEGRYNFIEIYEEPQAQKVKNK